MRWNDKLVKEFARVACAGSYRPYEGCRTLESKMKRFKELQKSKKKEQHEK